MPGLHSTAAMGPEIDSGAFDRRNRLKAEFPTGPGLGLLTEVPGAGGFVGPGWNRRFRAGAGRAEQVSRERRGGGHCRRPECGH